MAPIVATLRKNLTNYVGTAWYQDNVIKERLMLSFWVNLGGP